MKYLVEKMIEENLPVVVNSAVNNSKKFNRLVMAGKSAGVVAGSYGIYRGGKWYLNRRKAKKEAIQNSQPNEQNTTNNNDTK